MPDEAVPAIHPCLFFYKNAKLPDIRINFLKSLQSSINPQGNSSSNEVKRFLTTLDNNYKAFLSALESTAISEEGFIIALKEYLGVLQALTSPNKPQFNELDAAIDTAAAVTGDAHTTANTNNNNNNDASSSATNNNNTSTTTNTNTTNINNNSASTTTTTSSLRFALEFSWNQSLVSETVSKPVKCRDAVFELASSIIAAAVWCIRRAGTLCESTPVGIASGPSLQAYKLLRQAAGLLQYCNASILPMLHPDVAVTGSLGIDCSSEALIATSLCCLADAQHITVLRAIQKGNEPALISSLARDARDQYTEAATALSSVPDATTSKLFYYLAYKQASFESYSHIFNAITQWKQGNAGAGLRSLKEAEISYQKAKKAANVYDKASPSSLGQLHRRFDDELDRILYDTQRRIEKENSTVYYQSIPSAAPALPEGKRLSAPDGFALPEKSKIAVELDGNAFTGLPTSPTDTKKKKKKTSNSGGGCSCTGPGCCCYKWLCCCCIVQAVTGSVVDGVNQAVQSGGGHDDDEKITPAKKK